MGRSGKTYVVKSGRQPGVYSTWAEAKAQVDGYSGAQFKSFTNDSAASAYMNSGSGSSGGSSGRSSSGGSSGRSSSGGSASYGSSSRYSGTPYARSSGSSGSSGRGSGGGSRNSSNSGGSHLSGKSGTSHSNQEHIYVDGSSLSNGRRGANAGWGNYFGEGDSRNSSGPVKGAQTNNRAELTALRRALDHVKDRDTKYVIHSDSEYSLKSVTDWGDKWEADNWKRSDGPVKNQDLIKDIRNTMGELQEGGYDVTFNKVLGHSNIHGNECADELARSAAGKS